MARQPIIQGGGRSDDPGSEDRSEESPFQQPADSEYDSDDARYDDALRPQRISEVVGQRKVIERLNIMLDATKKRGEPLGHLLLDGPPGLGKTTLATVVPKELDRELQITSGPSLAAPKDLLPYLTNASYGSVLFIDEIHRLPPTVEEFLYPAMEDFRVDITLGDGLNARTINMKLQPFTVIGATTRSGMLTAPLRDRFVNRQRLEFYDTEDLVVIVKRNALKLRTSVSDEAADEIARRSRGTPRKANNLLRWSRDYAESKADGHISHRVVLDSFAMLEVDDVGLEAQDRRYLESLFTVFSGGPAGLKAIAHSIDIPPDTLEDEVEPFLLRCGFIQRTPRGRMVTAATFKHLQLPRPRG